MTPTQLLPFQKSQLCPHRSCRAENWFSVDPAAACDSRIPYNCIACGRTFLHTVHSSVVTLFIVRCRSIIQSLPPLLGFAGGVAVLYSGWFVAHSWGLSALTVLLVGCGVCLSIRHEGISAIPDALLLFVSTIVLTRFVLIYVLHRTAELNGICAVMVLVVGGAAFFGAPPAPYVPQQFYDPSLLNPGKDPDEITPEDLEKVGL